MSKIGEWIDITYNSSIFTEIMSSGEECFMRTYSYDSFQDQAIDIALIPISRNSYTRLLSRFKRQDYEKKEE